MSREPLVSILISAYNAERWLAQTLESAVGQTWPRKEIILVNDGSRDRTLEIAERFASQGVMVISTENRGLSAGINCAYRNSHGDYIQFLDADDVLARDKIEQQLAALRSGDSQRLLLSSPWAYFYHRVRAGQWFRNSLWGDLSPIEWLLRKMTDGSHMQNATWLVSRELTEAAGPWREDLHYDQDGEYFARVLLASIGTRFVSETGIYYRANGSSRISRIGNSDRKKNSLFLSMKLHIQYIRSLEDSERVRDACVRYMQLWYDNFYPSRPDIVAQVRNLARELNGSMEQPQLRKKYAWMAPIVGWETAHRVQVDLPEFKDSLIRGWDKLMYRLETLNATRSAGAAQRT